MGLKRFRIRKNDTSPAFVIGDRTELVLNNSNSGFSPAARLQSQPMSPVPETTYSRLRQQLQQKQVELERLEQSRKLAISRSFDAGIKRPVRLERYSPAQAPRNSFSKPGFSSQHKGPLLRGQISPSERNTRTYLQDPKPPSVFKIPHYTKRHPKVVRNNPITGLVPE